MKLGRTICQSQMNNTLLQCPNHNISFKIEFQKFHYRDIILLDNLYHNRKLVGQPQYATWQQYDTFLFCTRQHNVVTFTT
jgi:hypothetical protein